LGGNYIKWDFTGKKQYREHLPEETMSQLVSSLSSTKEVNLAQIPLNHGSIDGIWLERRKDNTIQCQGLRRSIQ
jgi:hypothetical protein